ncbi:hypothetical protein RS3R6_08100 [Pseudomonas atacamensis]|nr:hypothetical protein RS3R6_08100 [Pseudomonas atacamensis]
MTHRIREQARSHKWNSVWTEISATNKAHVGASLLAKGSCQALMHLNDTPHSRAGSLPQMEFGLDRNFRHDQCPCGSELAREEVLSGTDASE